MPETQQFQFKKALIWGNNLERVRPGQWTDVTDACSSALSAHAGSTKCSWRLIGAGLVHHLFKNIFK